MKLLQGAALILICAFLSNCKHGNTVNNTRTDTSKKVEKIQEHPVATEKDTLISDTTETKKLKYGFTIVAGHNHGAGKFKSSDFLDVWHNKIKLLTDTSQEYKFDEEPYPILNQLRPGVFELLIEFDNRPSKDLVTFFRIKNDKIIRTEQMPTFDGQPEKINGEVSYHSVWDYGEVWGKSGKMYTTYNPEIYYKFTADGIKLDTALTILKNKHVYGRFEGFTYKGTIGYPSDDRGNITDTTAKNVFRKPGND